MFFFENCILFKFVPMVPDYPYKTFGDERRSYCLLMEVLAMGPYAWSPRAHAR